MRKLAWLLAAALAWCPAGSGAENGSWFQIENGMAQPVAAYTDARSPDYSNEDSELLRFAVYVETDYDTDLDGKPDLIKAMVQVPRAAAEGRCRVPVLYEARPYIAGMYTFNPELPAPGETVFDETALYTMPGKREVKGETTALELAKAADPADWHYQLDSDPFGQEYLGNLTAYDYFLVRGFAVVQSAGPGTWGSEGIQCCTGGLEIAAFRCVVEWLTGDRNAFSDPEHGIRIGAEWCSGKIGMTGRSYAGAMAFGVASTGVKGLETVVPVAGVASWYEYANAQGAPSGLMSSYDFIADLSAMCASRFPAEDKALESLYIRYLAWLRDEQIALAGDYGPFWEARDRTSSSAFRASALIVQGLNDETVRPVQAERMREAFLAAGCEVRCILHQNGHVTPANEQTRTDILIGDHTYLEWLNLWFTHYLLEEDNGIDRMPAMLVQSNLDGVFRPADPWNTGEVMTLCPDETGEFTVAAENAHLSNSALVRETFDGRSGPDRLLWRTEIPRETTVNGTAAVHLRVRTEDTDRKFVMMGAVLVDQADEAFPCFDPGDIGVLDQKTVLENGADSGGGAEPWDLAEWVPKTANRKVITWGTMDLLNPEAGRLPASAARREEPVRAGSWQDYTLYLQPAVYTLPAGHRLELYIVPFCGFSDDHAVYDTTPAEDLAETGIDPDTLAPFTRDYRFTVDNGFSRAEIPVVR